MTEQYWLISTCSQWHIIHNISIVHMIFVTLSMLHSFNNSILHIYIHRALTHSLISNSKSTRQSRLPEYPPSIGQWLVVEFLLYPHVLDSSLFRDIRCSLEIIVQARQDSFELSSLPVQWFRYAQPVAISSSIKLIWILFLSSPRSFARSSARFFFTLLNTVKLKVDCNLIYTS